ncbi:ATP-binding protein [Sphingomonas naphthae]|uniref:histidine kinase n=2 Tax=Sphingomonas naphthae TaxID=1813468 RepID=A0ABY7TQE9_9SPHN|nr:sensor histidine kinase [Sphingomonas naphthae]WCT75457.1 ATP-binding protein [Sphingomonas naphthae]
MALGFLAVLAAAVSAGVVMVRTQDRAFWVDHTYQVERGVTGIRLSLEQMRSTRRGALLRLSPTMRDSYYKAAADLHAHIDRVANLTADNPVQQARARRLKALATTVDGMLTASLSPGALATPEAEDRRQAAGAAVGRLAATMLAAEAQLLIDRRAEQQASYRLFYIVLAVTLLLLVGVAAGSVWIIRRYTRDLNTSRTALRGLNENLEGAVRERTTDLQRANDEIQRFAYIVSHDLRSPLVNVMGFTAELDAATKPIAALIDKAEEVAPEIVTQDARLAAKEDLPEAIRFIRTSTQKMDRLINAILRLSREGRRTLAPERLDMTALVQDIVGTLKHRTEELGITIRVAPKLPDIVSDRVAIEQILSNLIENATKYLHPARKGEIDVRGRIEAGRVTYDVIDNGRGVDPRDHERIFDLFRRSGQQDQPGEGIGLAHVRALAYRLGGTISITSQLGEGATFHINLPTRFVEEKKA